MSTLRTLIEAANAALCRLKRNRRLPVPADPRDGRVKLNLGCGLAVSKGWINVDASPNALIASWPPSLHAMLYRVSGASQYYSLTDYCSLLREHAFVHHDLAHSLPFADACADFVYSSHFLEHLFRPDALRLLQESHRVLRPGGTVRVCVPDLAHAVELYRQGHKKQALNNYFFVEDQSSFLARHKYMYDFELLEDLLHEAGFSAVTPCSYRQGETPDIEMLDNRPEETLFVEARKAGKAG